jgi:Condensation domain/Phosphopantetheine attachment site
MLRTGEAARLADRLQDVEANAAWPLGFEQERLLGMPGRARTAARWLRFSGAFDERAFQWAVEALVHRHEALRTRIRRSPTGALSQEVVEPDKVFVPVLELSSEYVGERLEAWAREIAGEPLDLAITPFRSLLCRLAPPQGHLFIFSVDLTACDGLSAGILVHDLCALYYAGQMGKTPALPALICRPTEYARWQRAALIDGGFDLDLDYWRDRLRSSPRPTYPLTTAPARSEGGLLQVELGAPLVAGLTRVARSERASLFMLLVAAVATVLHLRSGLSDVVFGAAVGGRHDAKMRHTVGCFANLLVIRMGLQGAINLREILRAARDAMLDGLEHSQVPFSLIAQTSNLVGASELGVVLGYQCHPQQAYDTESLTIVADGIQPAGFRAALCISLEESRDRIKGQIEYSDAVNAADAMAVWLDYQLLLQRFAETPDSSLPPSSEEVTRPIADAASAEPDVELVVEKRNDFETPLRLAWQDVLARSVELDENFFELGGRSSLLVEIQARLLERSGIDLSLLDLFRFPTIRALARHLGGVAPLLHSSGRARGEFRRRNLQRRPPKPSRSSR